MNANNGARGGLSVGGPNGIHIDGGNVYVGGQTTPPGGPGPMVATLPASHLVAPRSPAAVLEPLGRHAAAVSTVLSVGAGLLLVAAGAVIGVMQLPWLLLAAPGSLSVGLIAGAVSIRLVARKRRAKGGVDPDLERRILDVAVACRGRLTVTAAAHALSMPLAEADAALTTLAKAGHVGIDNDPATGVVVYVFPDIEAGLVPMRRLP